MNKAQALGISLCIAFAGLATGAQAGALKGAAAGAAVGHFAGHHAVAGAAVGAAVGHHHKKVAMAKSGRLSKARRIA